MEKIKYTLNGAIYAELEATAGEPAPKPENAPEKAGYRLLWVGADQPVPEGGAEYPGIYLKGDPEMVSLALGGPMMGFPPEGREHPGTGAMAGAISILYLLAEIRRNPEAEYLIDEVCRRLRYFVDAENNVAPQFDLCCYWAYCDVSAAIALAHKTDAVWSKLDADTKARYDLVMAAFGYTAALGTNDENRYSTGPGLVGNYGKDWNPNYRLANVTPIVFVGDYFGGRAALDEMLLAFDYDKTIAEFKKYGFERAYKCWTAPAPVLEDGTVLPGQKTFMEMGGPAYVNTTHERLHLVPGTPAGTGIGVRAPYIYKGATLDNPGAIIANLFAHNYSGGPVKSRFGEFADGSPKAFIADNSDSPMEGKLGMMRELASGDGGNGKDGPDIRSSTSYCLHDFLMVVGAMIALEELGIYRLRDKENEEIYHLAWVGNTDYLYKCSHGYMSYSLGKQHGIAYESGDAGFKLTKAWWLEHFSDTPKGL